MGLHAYCITAAGTQPRHGSVGLAGAPLHGVVAAELCAWCSSHAQPPAAAVEQLRTHDRVIRTALAEAPSAVPLRFGQWFPGQAELGCQLAERAPHWLTLLERFTGTVEMGLRLARQPAGAPPLRPHLVARPGDGEVPGSGRAYLERLQAAKQAESASLAERDELLAALASLAGESIVAASCEAVPDREGLWRVAHLVRSARLTTYEAAIGELRRRHPGARVLLTGPWPPYSFAADAE